MANTTWTDGRQSARGRRRQVSALSSVETGQLLVTTHALGQQQTRLFVPRQTTALSMRAH